VFYIASVYFQFKIHLIIRMENEVGLTFIFHSRPVLKHVFKRSNGYYVA